MHWVKLTDLSGGEVYVNLGGAMSIFRDGSVTKITFPGGEEDVVRVKEAPETVIRRVRIPAGSGE